MTIPSTPLGLHFVPGDVLTAMERIHDAGFDVWIVGGALRDHLLGEAPKDWDLATAAGPAQIMKIFPHVIPVGIRHGTVQIHTRTRDIEVTSFDPPGEAGILKDLGRRDFTINAMALSFPGGVLIDPHGGRADLDAGLIRGVGDSRSRFAEDPLRIVRAARLSGIYGFAVDSKTFEAIREESENLPKVSGERVRDEFCKILLSSHPIEAVDLLRKTWALGKLLPELAARDRIDTMQGSGMSIYRHSLLCVVNCPLRLRVRLAALFINAAVPAIGARGEKLPIEYRVASAAAAALRMKKWNMSNRRIRAVSVLIENQIPPGAEFWSDARIRRFIARVGPELLDDFAVLARAERLARGVTDIEGIKTLLARMRQQLELAPPLRMDDLALGGKDIMGLLGIPPGPEVGRVLKELFDHVLEDPGLNTREHLTDIVERDFGGRK
ncbi:MAG: CCA tRNA nucleotidyltransferase [Syntrophobacteraceae bacterium]